MSAEESETNEDYERLTEDQSAMSDISELKGILSQFDKPMLSDTEIDATIAGQIQNRVLVNG